MQYSEKHIQELQTILTGLNLDAIERVVQQLVDLRARDGRLFILGVGGSAANASHAVNDFRKLTGIETYAPTDNVSELTARVNDEGWETVFVAWLKCCHLSARDLVFVLSVGGGDLQRNVSPNLVRALDHARNVGAPIIGIVGRDGGFTAQVADACVIIPTVDPCNVTPHTESMQSVILHLLVAHPALKAIPTKWEVVK